VAVVGPDSGAGDEARAAARAIGRDLARRGCVLVCGGLGGVMAAACEGAQAEGGVTVGILPGTDRRAANPHVGVAIATGLGELRNGLVVRSADVVIAVGGEYGTLAEVAFALKTGVPGVGLSTWELSRAGVPDEGIIRCRDAAEAVEQALSAAGRRAP